MWEVKNELLMWEDEQVKLESIKKLNIQIWSIELWIAIMTDEIFNDKSEWSKKLLENFNNRLMELKKQRDEMKWLNKN